MSPFYFKHSNFTLSFLDSINIRLIKETVLEENKNFKSIYLTIDVISKENTFSKSINSFKKKIINLSKRSKTKKVQSYIN